MNFPLRIGNAASGTARQPDQAASPASQPSVSPRARTNTARVGGDAAGPARERPPSRPRAAPVESPEEQAADELAGFSSMERMAQLNEQQEKMALMTATMQANATRRAEMLQMVRDLAKDAKDAIKDIGEAGHKP